MTLGQSSNAIKASQKNLALATHFEAKVADGASDELVVSLIDRGVVTDIGDTREGFKTITLDFPKSELQEKTPGRPELRHKYPPNFFKERILTGDTRLPADPTDYQLVVHPVHAYCVEASHVAGIVKGHFPQIKDPIIRNLVAALLVTSSSPPSWEDFSFCFSSPPSGVTEDAIWNAYHEVQENRPSSLSVLRSSLAKFQSARERSKREIREMLEDLEYNPEQDKGDRFNLLNVLERGLTIEVKKDALPEVISNACPNAEKLKLAKLLFVKVHDRPLNKEAKVALGAHDAFDHMFFFELIHRTGLAETILPKIGNFKFSTVDSIFSVPAEYVAMVAYDWRAWMEFGSQHQRPVGPILAAAKRTLRAGLDDNLIPEKLRSTIESFLDLPDEHWTVQQFAFVLRGIQWENGEMAIKWGPLDLRPQQTIQDPHTEPWGPTPILQEPCYLALVICGLATLNDPKHGARDVLERINYTLEHELSEAIKHYETSDEPYSFELTLQGLREDESPDVPEPIRKWFKEHMGFASVREPLCA